MNELYLDESKGSWWGKIIMLEAIHNHAIDKSYMAIIMQSHKDFEKALSLNREAFLLEKKVALLAKAQKIGEPSESVLLKSAACMAISCKEFQEAEELILIALAGEPPQEIAEELNKILLYEKDLK